MGVWIEIVRKTDVNYRGEKSLPLVGVWIEIYQGYGTNLLLRSHSPWWECGLKSRKEDVMLYKLPVTPLGGSVD